MDICDICQYTNNSEINNMSSFYCKSDILYMISGKYVAYVNIQIPRNINNIVYIILFI